MTPRFANAVDPIFLYVLGLLDKIGQNEPVPAEEAREGIQNRFREAEAQLSEKTDPYLAREHSRLHDTRLEASGLTATGC